MWTFRGVGTSLLLSRYTTWGESRWMAWMLGFVLKDSKGFNNWFFSPSMIGFWDISGRKPTGCPMKNWWLEDNVPSKEGISGCFVLEGVPSYWITIINQIQYPQVHTCLKCCHTHSIHFLRLLQFSVLISWSWARMRLQFPSISIDFPQFPSISWFSPRFSIAGGTGTTTTAVTEWPLRSRPMTFPRAASHVKLAWSWSWWEIAWGPMEDALEKGGVFSKERAWAEGVSPQNDLWRECYISHYLFQDSFLILW